MRTLILALVLSACTRPAPVAPQPPRNAAIDFAHTLLESAACFAMRTAEPKQADTAVCDFNQVLAYCRAGVGAGSRCSPFADLQPKPEQPPAPPPKPADAAPAKPAEAPKTDPPKTELKRSKEK